MGYTIDIDTGGTFTDGFFTRGEQVATAKVPTTPHDLTVCFFECIKAGAACFGVPVEDLLHDTDIIRFSNTIGTNTLIQRDGSKVGLIVSAGKESLAPTAAHDGEAPLVAPDMVLGVEESVSDSGQVLVAPDEHKAMAAAQALIDRGARCLVVAFSNSELNPANERAVQRTIKREYPRDYLGSVPVFLSSNISVRSGEQERVNAAVINAYIHAKLVRLLYKAGEDLRQRLYAKSLFIGHSNGAAARVAKTRAINTYNSGPASGLLGARLLGDLYDADSLITADMGGTSFDLGYVRNRVASYSLNPNVEGFPVNVPMLAIRAIGAGGGSIASVRDGELRVGPQSAGALPGPVCFDLGGTEPTVTDANLVLGILDPEYFLGGTMKLHHAKAAAAIETKIGAPLGLSVDEAALRIKQTVDANMAREVARLKSDTGSDDPLLLMYGGAGPAHCCDIAHLSGLSRVVVSPFSAVFSAFGSSTLDVGHLYYRRVDSPLGNDSRAVLAAAVEAMRAEAERDLRGEGYAESWAVSAVELFVRNGGADTKVEVDPGFADDSAGIETALASVRAGLAGADDDADTLDTPRVTAISLKAEAGVPHYKLAAVPIEADAGSARPQSTRSVFLSVESGRRDVPVYGLADLRPGDRVSSPAVVESADTTFFVQTGWQLRVDDYRNCVLEEASER